MRIPLFPQVAWIAAGVAFAAAGPARAAVLYAEGDLGISWFAGDGVGTNDIVGISNSGKSEDETPVWGGALGIQFPLSDALPWRMRLPGFGVPYWPGRELRFEGSDDVRFPAWEVRTEVEHLRGRDAEMTTPSFNPLDAYRSDVEVVDADGKAAPRRAGPRAGPRAAGTRAPFLEPVTLYGGMGAGIGETDLDVSTGLLVGSTARRQQFAWQALAGIGYDLNDHVKLSVGWRYVDLGEAKTQLFDSTFTNRGRYSIDLDAHEFTMALSVWFWRLPPLLGDE